MPEKRTVQPPRCPACGSIDVTGEICPWCGTRPPAGKDEDDAQMLRHL